MPSVLTSVIKYVKLQRFECNYLGYCLHSRLRYEVAIGLACLVIVVKVMMI